VIWFTKQESDSLNNHYKVIDYLCDGILTASQTTLHQKSSLVLAATNFGSPLMVFVAKSIVKKEVESFLTLVKIEEVAAGNILLVDDGNLLPELERMFPKKVTEKLKRVN
jgi:hypothetical protein